MRIQHTKGKSSSRRLVDDPLDLKTSDPACIPRSLTLRIVEVCWDGDNRLLDWPPDELFRNLLEVGKDTGSNLFRGHNLRLPSNGDLNGSSSVSLVNDSERPSQVSGILNHFLAISTADQTL
mmetsp:Transcript_45216/g.142338  ORF Transcript_45216/g.142338 Transcript_45216/m.142338 type:complete len:122 (-) Transcript_45216:272-637(-)